MPNTAGKKDGQVEVDTYEEHGARFKEPAVRDKDIRLHADQHVDEMRDGPSTNTANAEEDAHERVHDADGKEKDGRDDKHVDVFVTEADLMGAYDQQRSEKCSETD